MKEYIKNLWIRITGKLDFVVRCKTSKELAPLKCIGLKGGRGETVTIPMKSGRPARFRVTAEVSRGFEDPFHRDTLCRGVADWHFKFLGYVKEDK